MLQRSKFSIQLLTGLLSIGFLGAVVAHPSSASPAPSSPSSSSSSNSTRSTPSTGLPATGGQPSTSSIPSPTDPGSSTSGSYSQRSNTTQSAPSADPNAPSTDPNAPANVAPNPSQSNDRNSVPRSPATLDPATPNRSSGMQRGSSMQGENSMQSAPSADPTAPSANPNAPANVVPNPSQSNDRNSVPRSPATLNSPSGMQRGGSMQGENSMQSTPSTDPNAPSTDPNAPANVAPNPSQSNDRNSVPRSPATLDPSGMQRGQTAPRTQSRTSDTSSESVSQIVSNSSSFHTLAAALKAAGLDQVLDTQGPVTLFAPTDKAFEALPAGTLQRLLQPQNREALREVLAYHLVAGNYPSSDIQAGEVETAGGAPVTITTRDGAVTVGGASVVEPDINAQNGVIHAIDKVLLPPNLQIQ
jgi:uncharacterized surface protein with fasciclin (FAS1) repeats